MQNNSLNHPTHPVRNFFYVLWSFLNILAFAGLFFSLLTLFGVLSRADLFWLKGLVKKK